MNTHETTPQFPNLVFELLDNLLVLNLRLLDREGRKGRDV